MNQPQFRAVSRAFLGRALLVFALLAGQHAAVSHQIWHAAGADAREAGKASSQRALCDLHGALDAVLGALASGFAVLASEAGATPFTPPPVLAAAAPPPLPASRGPPAAITL